jgi:hypothetical protein
MSLDPNTHQHVRRIVLPSGKTIEVVYYEEHPDVPLPSSARDVDLSRCAECGSRLVYPLDWEEAGTRDWQVTLRCPECLSVTTGVYDQATVDRFDEALDDGTDALVRDLKRLMRANMEDEVERFASALHAGAILPEDF